MWEMGAGSRRQRAWWLRGRASRVGSWVCWIRRGMGTARRRMVFSLLRRGMASWSDLGRVRGSGPDKAREQGFGVVRAGRRTTRRGERPPEALGLWGGLPSA